MRAILIAAAVTTAALFRRRVQYYAHRRAEPPPRRRRHHRAAEASVSTVDVTKPAASGISPLKDPNNILSKRSIYFEFDRFDVKDEYRPIVEAHAKYLRDNPAPRC